MNHDSTNSPAGLFASVDRRGFLLSASRLLVAPVLSASCLGLGLPAPAAERQKSRRPAYLKVEIDPVFGSRVTRITDDPGTMIAGLDAKWDSVARHSYSKNCPWNCDQSLLCLAVHHGFPSMIFVDGTDYRPQFGRNSPPVTEVRWHPKNPDLMIYVRGNEIGFWNVRKDTFETVGVFPDYSDFQIGPWEGNVSADGRKIAVSGRKDGNRVAFVYDLATATKLPDLSLGDITVDWVSVSPSGKFLVLNGSLTPSGRGDQTKIYQLDGSEVGDAWLDYGRPSHFDMCVDENGDDIAVGVSKSPPDEGRIIKRRLLDGKVTVLTTGGYASHVSTRNIRRPGWAYATYQYAGPEWPPYWNEAVAIRLDGSGTVERIAQLHTQCVDYLSEAHVVPSPDGRRVLWAGNGGAASGRPIGTYVAEVVGASV